MPTLADLDAAMLRPGRSVPAVNRLGGGTIAMAGSDQPWRVVGRACAVYQLRQPSGRVLALRCPLADARELDPTLGDRYRAFGSDPALARLRAAGGPLVADVTLVPDGLAFPAPDFRSAPHPLMAMEWVMGPTLLAATDRACHRGDRPYLAALADVWAATIGALATAGFSHGDLAADNALVRPAGSGGSGGIALIDYDTCAWRGVPPPRSAAPGPGYAHPSGAVPPLEQRDHFPALVVYASLRVLALWPELREQHGDSPGRTGGVILFGPQDLRDPDASTLFGALRVLDDPAVKQLLAMLREACLAPVTATPPLTQVVARVRDADARRRIDQGGLGDAAPGGSAGTRLAAAPRPTEGGRGSRHPTLAPLSTSAVPTPPAAPLAPPVGQDARERQRRLTRLNSLLLAGDEEGAQRFWSESGLESDPDAVRELGPRMAELGRRRLLRLAREAAEAGDSATLLRLWDEGRFDDYRPAAPLLPMVEAARHRSGSVGRLRAALDTGDAATVLRLWPELRGDSLAATLAVRAHTVLAEQVGAEVAGALGRGDDEALVAAVRDAAANGVALDAATHRAARAAAVRLETRHALRAAAAVNDRATLATLALSGRLGELGRLEPALMRAVLRSLAWPHLERALAADEDAAIVAAYDDDLFADEGALTAEQRTRIELAAARTAWVEAVRSALRERDVPALRAALAEPPPGAEARLTRVERSRIERLTAREEAVERLEAALREGPDAAIVAALGRVEAAGAPLPAALDWAAVRGVVDRMTLADAIREAAAADPPDYARLARLLPAARAAVADGAAGLGDGVDFARLETDMLRAAHLARLREALANDDDAAIAAAADPDPYGALPRLTAEQRVRVAQALASRRGTASLRGA